MKVEYFIQVENEYGEENMFLSFGLRRFLDSDR